MKLSTLGLFLLGGALAFGVHAAFSPARSSPRGAASPPVVAVALAAGCEVRGIPCFVLVKGGREAARQTGAIPKSGMRRMLGL